MPTSATKTDLECRRTRRRSTIARASTVRTDYSGPIDVSVEDLSQDGFRFSTNMSIASGTLIRVGLAGAGQASAQIAWQNGESHGCIFLPALTDAQIEAAFSHSGKAPAVASLTLEVESRGPVSAAHGVFPKISLRARFAVIIFTSAFSWVLSVFALRALQTP